MEREITVKQQEIAKMTSAQQDFEKKVTQFKENVVRNREMIASTRKEIQARQSELDKRDTKLLEREQQAKVTSLKSQRSKK